MEDQEVALIVRFLPPVYDVPMRQVSRIGGLMCLIGHKWRCTRIDRIDAVRYVSRCQRCGWHKVSRDPNLFTRRPEVFSGVLQ